ncbi:MAG: DUF1577 domain-containing protein [Leptospiraceae bacterium]|nr:DUF1577 domain-containing protein [Leptospiraceae bacterium]
MFREIFFDKTLELETKPSFFEEIPISIRLPVLEKKWSKLEHDIQTILKIVQEGKQLSSEDSNKISVEFLKTSEDGSFYFKTSSKIDLGQSKEFVLYKKQKNGILELGFELLNFEGTTIACKPKTLRSSQEKRLYTRFFNKENLIYAEDFEIAEWKENLSDYLKPDIEDLFYELEKDYKITHPNLEIFYLYPSKKLNLEEKLVASEKKPIFVEVEKELESYPGDFVNLRDFYISQKIFEFKMEILKKQKVSSFILYPIFFKFKNKQIFIGVGYLWATYPTKIPTSDIFLLEEIETKINSKILEGENARIHDPQKIINFSKGGILFQISNYEIVQAILARPKFSAKICKTNSDSVRLQFYAKSIYQIEMDYYVGAEILGNSHSDINIQTYFEWIQEREI